MSELTKKDLTPEELNKRPYFKVYLCRYQQVEDGPWYVGILLNDGHCILSKRGNIVDSIFDYKSDEDELTLNVGPIIGAYEESLQQTFGNADWCEKVSLEDPMKGNDIKTDVIKMTHRIGKVLDKLSKHRLFKAPISLDTIERILNGKEDF